MSNSLSSGRALLAMGLSALLVFSSLPALAKDRVTCESKNYRYQYCRVDTGNRVKLKKQISESSCVSGRTWGYDSRGIWVDNGCAAEFEVGKGNNKDDKDNKDGLGTAAAAAAVVGGLAILGSLMGGQQSGTSQYPGDRDVPAYPSDRDVPAYPSDRYTPDYSSDRYGATVPNWAVGTFRGNNPMYNTTVELTIGSNGRVTGYAGRTPLQGYFDGRQLEVAGSAFRVEPDSRGFRTVDLNDSRNQMRYVRVR